MKLLHGCNLSSSTEENFKHKINRALHYISSWIMQNMKATSGEKKKKKDWGKDWGAKFGEDRC